MMRALRNLPARDLGLMAAAIALFLDQASKLALLYWAGFMEFLPGERVRILPFFDLVMVWNPGVSYGLFAANSALGRDALILVAFAAIVGLTVWLWYTPRRSFAAGLGLVIGGAIGNNLIDRMVYGRVADFFHFFAFGYDWYVFNIADVAITAGVAVILYDAVLRPDAPAVPQGAQAGETPTGVKHEGR